MTAFTMEATSLYSSTSGHPKSVGNGQESVSSHTRGLQETSRSQDASSATDPSVVFPQPSRAAPTWVTGSEFTSSDGISGPDFTQSMGNTNIFNHPLPPSMADSSHTTFRTPTSTSGATPERTLPLNIKSPASREERPSAEMQASLPSEVTTSVTGGLEAQSWTRSSLEEGTQILSPLVLVLNSTSVSSVFSKARDQEPPVLLCMPQDIHHPCTSQTCNPRKPPLSPDTGSQKISPGP